jgi:hypothetical protein
MSSDDETQPDPRCSTCHRRVDESTIMICVACQLRATNQHAEIPSLLDRLAYEAVRGTTSEIGEYVSGGAFGSRAPARVDALSLTATTAAAIGLALASPQPPDPHTSLPLWIVRWAAVWRQRFGHHQPVGVRVRPAPPPPVAERFVPPEDPAERRELARAITPDVNALLRQRAADAARRTAYRARVELGMELARARNRAVKDPTVAEAWTKVDRDNADLLAAHWIARFGPPRQVRRIVADTAYLTSWFDRAVEEFHDIAEYVLGLRSLVAAARSAVGERSDVVVLGRCPEVLHDRVTGEDEYCGARLSRDPMVTVIICPRCRAETNERGLLNLAVRMRAIWGESADRETWAA